MDRRQFLTGVGTCAAIGLPSLLRAAETFRTGLTPVFQDNVEWIFPADIFPEVTQSDPEFATLADARDGCAACITRRSH